ncbi:uncharacterized protein LOC126833636 [Adelges cooleyi]|uniref:uncharacterized protein LOC126833636 n=1 Tax=Adelges cooleyi TaxID=133065 RepID=UPI00217FE24E|nr:uncharacterized protein LOC126833636 [Adelges cooleyi]
MANISYFIVLFVFVVFTFAGDDDTITFSPDLFKVDAMAVYKFTDKKGFIMFVETDGVNPQSDKTPLFVINESYDDWAYVDIINKLLDKDISSNNRYGRRIYFEVSKMKFGTIKANRG